MIRLATEVLKPIVIALPFVERFGGLAKAITANFEGSGDAFAAKTFPISCDLNSKECFELGKYQNLLPNDKYKSVAYFEHNNNTKLVESNLIGNPWEASTTIRFVCWLNMRLLGLDDCFGTSRFEIVTAKDIIGVHRFTVDSIDGKLTVRTANIVQKDPRVIFGRYSYADKDHVFHHPFDFFAIDFDLKIEINPACLNDMTIPDPLDCLTTW